MTSLSLGTGNFISLLYVKSIGDVFVRNESAFSGIYFTCRIGLATLSSFVISFVSSL